MEEIDVRTGKRKFVMNECAQFIRLCFLIVYLLQFINATLNMAILTFVWKNVESCLRVTWTWFTIFRFFYTCYNHVQVKWHKEKDATNFIFGLSQNRQRLTNQIRVTPINDFHEVRNCTLGTLIILLFDVM